MVRKHNVSLWLKGFPIKTALVQDSKFPERGGGEAKLLKKVKKYI